MTIKTILEKKKTTRIKQGNQYNRLVKISVMKQMHKKTNAQEWWHYAMCDIIGLCDSVLLTCWVCEEVEDTKSSSSGVCFLGRRRHVSVTQSGHKPSLGNQWQVRFRGRSYYDTIPARPLVFMSPPTFLLKSSSSTICCQGHRWG